MGYLAVAAAAVLWGLWAVLLTPAQLSGPQVSSLLFLVMALPSLVWTRRPLKRDARSVRAMVILGFCDAGNAVLYFAAIRRGPLAVAVLSHYLAPMLVALFGPWLLKEAPSRRAVIAAPVALCGLAMVIYRPGAGFAWTTVALGAGSAVFYAANVLTSKAAAPAYSAIEITSLHAILSLVVVVIAFRGAALPPLDSHRLAFGIGATLFNGLLANTLFNVGLRRIPAPAASALTYLEPLTAALLGAALFAEPLGWVALIGTAAVLLTGAWVAIEPPRGEPAAHS